MEDTEKERSLPEQMRGGQAGAWEPGQRQGDLWGTYALLRASRHTWRRRARMGRRAFPVMGQPCPDAGR